MEEDLTHYFCECPKIAPLWNQLKLKILTFTENNNRYPPINNLSVLLFDPSGTRKQIRTAIWTLSTILSKVYDWKEEGRNLTFDSLWDEVKDDLEVAIHCKGGKHLDNSIMM